MAILFLLFSNKDDFILTSPILEGNLIFKAPNNALVKANVNVCDIISINKEKVKKGRLFLAFIENDSA